MSTRGRRKSPHAVVFTFRKPPILGGTDKWNPEASDPRDGDKLASARFGSQTTKSTRISRVCNHQLQATSQLTTLVRLPHLENCLVLTKSCSRFWYTGEGRCQVDWGLKGHVHKNSLGDHLFKYLNILIQLRSGNGESPSEAAASWCSLGFCPTPPHPSPAPRPRHPISSGDIPNSMRCFFECSHHPAALAEPRGTLVEPSWNPRGTLVELSWNPGKNLVEPW